MTLFTLQIECDNDAFTPDTEGPSTELERILYVVARNVALGRSASVVVDVNGNTVGSWEIR